MSTAPIDSLQTESLLRLLLWMELMLSLLQAYQLSSIFGINRNYLCISRSSTLWRHGDLESITMKIHNKNKSKKNQTHISSVLESC